MPGIGTLANCVAIIIGALLGVFCKRGLPEKWQATMMNSIALCIFIIGVQMALKTQNIIIVIFKHNILFVSVHNHFCEIKHFYIS